MRSRAGYKPLQQEVEDSRFTAFPSSVPVGSIALAIFLMLFGICCFVLAWMHFTQEILGKEQAEYGLTILGVLTLLPGFYHTRIAFYAWQGRPGYNWDQIPQ